MSSTTPPDVQPPAAAEATPWLNTWPPIVVCLVGLVFAGAAMAQMNELHASMHVEGKSAGTLGDLNQPLRLEPDQERAAGLLGVWREYEASSRPTAEAPSTKSPHEVGKRFILIDSFAFVLFYTVGLALFFRRARWRIGKRLDLLDRDDAKRTEARVHDVTGLSYRKTLPASRKIASVGIVAVLLTAIFDELENVTYWRTLNVAFPGEGRAVDVETLERRIEQLWAFGGLKWLFAAVAIFTALAIACVLVTEWLRKPTPTGSPAQ